MNKWKIIAIVLLVLFVLAILYGGLTTIAFVACDREYTKIVSKYNEVIEDYKDLSGRYTETITEDLVITPVVESLARGIDESSTVSLTSDSVVHIAVPDSSDMRARLEEKIMFFPAALTSGEYKSCIITIVDDNGKCTQGLTVFPDGKNYAFLSE